MSNKYLLAVGAGDGGDFISGVSVCGGVMHWTWLVTTAAIVGTVANVWRKRWGFAVWMVTDLVWCVRDLMIGENAQAFLMAVYFGLGVWGFMAWGDGDAGKADL